MMPDKHKKQIKKANYPNHVWSWDFVSITTACGKPLRIMTLVDEYTRRFLAFHVANSITHKDVLRVLLASAKKYGMPVYIRSDNGPEFIAKMLKAQRIWLKIGINYIDRGCPWQNAWIESFHGKLRDECLNQEEFYSLLEAKVVLQECQQEYNTQPPHSSLNYLTPQEFYHKTKEEKRLNSLLFLFFFQFINWERLTFRLVQF